MKLRNKKTGEIADWDGIHITSENDGEMFDSIAELNEEWEDYETEKPLINDEKIRRAVLAWSSAYNESRKKEVKCLQYCQATDLVATDNCMCRITLPVTPELLHLNDYTIEELCGDEE